MKQLFYVASCGSSTTEGASDVSVSPFFTLPTACTVSCWVGLFCFVLVLFVFGSVFCMCGRHLFDHSCGCIQMTDHASSLTQR